MLAYSNYRFGSCPIIFAVKLLCTNIDCSFITVFAITDTTEVVFIMRTGVDNLGNSNLSTY